jgi:hypothetical protein
MEYRKNGIAPLLFLSCINLAAKKIKIKPKELADTK